LLVARENFRKVISAEKKIRKLFFLFQRDLQKYFFWKRIFPENIFRVLETFRKTFLKNVRLLCNYEKKFRPLVKPLKTCHKLLFSDVISMAGIRGGLNTVSCVKST